jgi:hypothetical protein
MGAVVEEEANNRSKRSEKGKGKAEKQVARGFPVWFREGRKEYSSSTTFPSTQELQSSIINSATVQEPCSFFVHNIILVAWLRVDRFSS